MADKNIGTDCDFIIFGGTGDLAFRKIIPAFYNLLNEGKLFQNINIIITGRRYSNSQEYLQSVVKAVEKHSRFELKDEKWERLIDKISYLQLDIFNDRDYQVLGKKLGSGRRIFYLALAPNLFPVIVDKLKQYALIHNDQKHSRLVIEKPFGHDLKSAKRLNQQLTQVFTENNIYRIDHYLGKEMLQNIMILRFANLLFEPVWNNKYVDNVQIISSESGGVKERGAYYDRSGALKDMVQNHMLQLITLTAMEAPYDMRPEYIKHEKVKVLKNIKIEGKGFGTIFENTVRGQYGLANNTGEKILSYRSEKDVAADSNTETFAALKVFIDNERWDGVPFYIKTGKKLKQKSSEIVIEFKESFYDFADLQPNLLVIRIQPREGLFLQLNAKKPGTEQRILPVKMDYCQNCRVGINSPEAYERLIYDVIRGDQTLFTSWEEVKYSWQFIDKIARAWNEKQPDFPNYYPGTDGPEEADLLLEKEGRHWWQIDPDINEWKNIKSEKGRSCLVYYEDS